MGSDRLAKYSSTAFCAFPVPVVYQHSTAHRLTQPTPKSKNVSLSFSAASRASGSAALLPQESRGLGRSSDRDHGGNGERSARHGSPSVGPEIGRRLGTLACGKQSGQTARGLGHSNLALSVVAQNVHTIDYRRR